MQINDNRVVAGRFRRRINTERERLAVRPRDRDGVDAADRRKLLRRDIAFALHELNDGIGHGRLMARVAGRERFDRLRLEDGELVEHRLHIGVRLARIGRIGRAGDGDRCGEE